MRNAFADELTGLAAIDERIVLLSGDIGNRLFDKYKAQNGNRFFNCGVAEANMASMAAGMAMCGLRPITYTITPFNTTRCLEQIRVDICYHNLPVIVVGTGAGLSYATLGCTHHSCEDLSFLRTIPNMTVLAPGDSFELRALLRETLKQSGPVYMRIGKTKEPVVHAEIPQLTIGKGFVMNKGNDICILSTGNMLPIALETGRALQAEVVSMHTVKPIDTELLADVCERFSLICTIEEHSLIGGLGSAVAEWMTDHAITTRLLRFGTRDEFPHSIGSQTYVRDYFGLNAPNITQEIIKYANSSSHPRRDEEALSR